MSTNESMEMYLETILIFEKRFGHAHVTDIAKELNVSKPSVTKATKYLREKGYIDKEPYGSVELTEKGREVAERIYRNHNLILRFLEHSLKMNSEDADKDACRIEHIISESMIEAIVDYLEKNNA